MEILAKRTEEGKVSILAKKDIYYVVMLDREKDILFLAKGNQLVYAFREYEQRCEKGMSMSCPTCDFMLAAEGVFSIQKAREFVYRISREEAAEIFKAVRLRTVWEEFVNKIK